MDKKEIRKALQKDLKKPSAMNFNHVVIQKAGIEPRIKKKEYFDNRSIVLGFLLTTLGFGFCYSLPVSEESSLMIKVSAVLIPLGFIAFNFISKQIYHNHQKSL